MMENEKQIEQDIILELFDNPSLSTWFASLLIQKQTECPDDIDAVESMIKLGYVSKINDKWTIEEKGRKIVEMLKLSISHKLKEKRKMKMIIVPERIQEEKEFFRYTQKTIEPYYPNEVKVKRIKEIVAPIKSDCDELLEIINGDAELTTKFYKDNDNANWLDLLYEAGEFSKLPPVVREGETIAYYGWIQGKYLTAVTEKEPEKVFEIIKGIESDNIYVIANCLQALRKMPLEISLKGIELIKRLLRKEFYLDWHFVAEEAAKIMEKFAEGEKWEESFEIARELLSVKIREGKHFQSWHDLEGRFDNYHYGELVFKHLKFLWEKEKQSLRVGKLLVEILDEQIKKEQHRKDEEPIPEEVKEKYKEILGEPEEEAEPFEITVHSYIMMPQIDLVEQEHPDIADYLVGGIRAIGEYLIKNNPDEAEKYIEFLHEKKRSLYERIIIHLHRFAPDCEPWNQQILDIIRNADNVNEPNTRSEYHNLLHDKYEMLSNDDKAPFFDWVEKLAKIEDMEDFQKWHEERHGHTADENEIEQYINYLKARELYCIKDKEPKYQEILEQSGKSDKAVKPWEGSGRVYSPAAPKYSPFSQEEMKNKNPEEVIRDILEYDSSTGETEFSEEDGHEVHPKDSLASEFSNDLKDRMEEYLQVDVSIISSLSDRYIRNFLYAIREVVQNRKLVDPDWDVIIELCKSVYDSRLSDKKYRAAIQAIPDVFGRVLRGKEHKEKITTAHLETIWQILESLLDYQHEMDKEEDEFDDPRHKCINRVRGVACETIIRFGLFCKNHKKKLFEEVYAVKLREKLQYVLYEVGRPYIYCVFGAFFINICWLDEEWVKENIDRIFPEDDEKKWGVIWGDYIHWGRPSELGFTMAKEKYSFAVDKIEGMMTDEDGESYNKRLMEHIMLAFWQEWTELEENGVVMKLLAKMDDPLRADACHWLSSGFEYLKDHKKDKWREGVVQRMRAYWEWRYGEIEVDPTIHNKEAREFTGWVKDSPFDEDETMIMAEKAVNLAGGVAVRRREVSDFIEGICAIAEGRELRVLQLLLKTIEDSEVERWSWYYEKVEEQLKSFMDKIVALPDEYEEIDKIRQSAIKVADSLGRFGFEYLKSHYDSLIEKLE
jgi:hypothetical protein